MALSPEHHEAFEKVLAHLHQELQSIRTGRANPAMVESLRVDAYGTPTPLVQLASVSVPEATQLVIQPWDPNVVKAIEKAVLSSPLGITPTVDGVLIRLHFPPLTEERRRELVKAVSEKLEMARVGIRSVREDVQKQVKQRERDGDISEDVSAQELKALQNEVDTYNEKIQQLGKQKEAELTTV